MHTEQNQINFWLRDKSLSFCFLLNSQAISMIIRQRKRYNDTAKEKSRLIIDCRKLYFYGLPVIRGKGHLLDKEVAADIAHA